MGVADFAADLVKPFRPAETEFRLLFLVEVKRSFPAKELSKMCVLSLPLTMQRGFPELAKEKGDRALSLKYISRRFPQTKKEKTLKLIRMNGDKNTLIIIGLKCNFDS